MQTQNNIEIRGVHGSSWVRLRRFFDPTHHGGLKKFNLTQPNPHELGWVELNPWVEQNFFFITIIIKLSKKKKI